MARGGTPLRETGALLGFWPGLLANYLRLRREKWTPGG
jgi:hypothetical protein